jgi:ATP/maltotriose-dependent transcriptional regulator MalT
VDLLERAAALAALDDLLAESAGGGRMALVAGEAGAGKSALVAAFTDRLGVRGRVLWGACDPLLTPRALGPLHDIARGLGGELRERLESGSRSAVFDALLSALDGPRASTRPVVVLEDLHWADEATLDMVTFLGRRLALCRALIVLTFREDEVGPDHPLRTVLAGLPARRLTLPPLSPDAVAELARRAGRPPGSLFAVTGGNPLLVTEVLTADAPGVPPTVRDLVLSRLGGLSPAAREVAGLVSVVPSAAEPALLADDLAAVEEALAGGVLTATAEGVGYRHELLRRAVEDALSPVRRAALHARVLAALDDRPGVDPARLVHHAHHAGDTAAVLHWAPIAARGAAAVGAYRQAADHYGRALAVRADAGLLESYAFVAYLAGRTAEALDARRRALSMREAAGDAAAAGENLRWVSRLCWWTGRTAEAREAGRRAIAVLEPAGTDRQRAMAYSNLSQLHMLADEMADAVTLGEKAIELARAAGDRETELHAQVNVASAAAIRGDRSGWAALAAVHERAAALGLDDHAGRALVNLAHQAVEWGDYDRAEAELDRVLDFVTARDLDGYARHIIGWRAGLRLARGDWAGARADATEALAGPDRPGPAEVAARVVLGRLAARCDRPGARELLETAAERAYEAGELQFIAPAATALAEYHWLAGDDAAAVAAARRAWPLAVRVGQPWVVGELAMRMWRAGAAPDDTVVTAEPYRRLLAGDAAGAAAEWAARGAVYPRAEALIEADPAAALREFDRLGATATARRVRAGLRDRGLPVPRGPQVRTRRDPSGLTARQREVLALITEGLSNADIAARLTLSAKTVDHHVSAVLAKLGVPSRGLAAAEARRRGL